MKTLEFFFGLNSKTDFFFFASKGGKRKYKHHPTSVHWHKHCKIYSLLMSRIKLQLKLVRLSKEASPVEIGYTTVRSWDNLNYDVLVEIMKRVPLYQRLYVACLVNRSWLSAVLDSLSPSGVINLKVMDSLKARVKSRYASQQMVKKKSRIIIQRYLCFLKRMLDRKPADSWSALYLGEVLLKSHKYVYIAKRTPSLQQLVMPEELGNTYSCFVRAMHYWRKLKKVQCTVSLFKSCLGSFKKVESLWLFGVVDDFTAIAIRDRCPRLKRLYLVSCALSINALSTILDGHKNLEVLDTRHSFRVRDCLSIIRKSKSVEWNEEEIRHKAAGIKLHLRCTKQRCSKCSASWKCCFPKAKRGLLTRNLDRECI